MKDSEGNSRYVHIKVTRRKGHSLNQLTAKKDDNEIQESKN